MTDKTGAAAETHAGISRADHDAALQGATKTAATAAAARVKTILGAKSATGRTTLAQHLALETDMPADQAVAILEKSPLEQAAKTSRLSGQVPAPEVDATEATSGDPQTIAAGWDKVVTQVNKETASARAR
jgi:hypothetical protein